MEKQKQLTKSWVGLSSQVMTTSYNPETKVMRVTFNTSGTYAYSNVPEEVWNESLKATSIGKFINSYIKNKYDFKKL